MADAITLKTIDPEAWFWADGGNVADSLRVMFEDERIDGVELTESWLNMGLRARSIRTKIINDALHDITIDEVTFANPEARPACDDISNLYELFKLLQEHPEARLTDVRYGNRILSSSIIEGRELLMFFAEDIAEDILDIEAELYSHTNDYIEEKLAKLDTSIARCEREVGGDDKIVCAGKEIRKRIADEPSPVEEFKAFMKEHSNAIAFTDGGQYIKLEFVLPYNDSIKEYIPNMEERWENYYCFTNLERPL